MLSFLFSCSHANEKQQEHQHENKQENLEMKEEKIETALVLNNGEKWPADDATRSTFSKMESELKTFAENTTEPKIKDYNALGENLQKELDILFKTCSMDGEAHEQLHTLVALIIGDVSSLRKSNETVAAEAYKKLPQHFKMFHEYFN